MVRELIASAKQPSAKMLLAWYDKHARKLPWRAVGGAFADPYAVWLSEIMLQQTTIGAVKPYYEKFLTRWPRVGDLAAAPVESVMQAWAGLGYYSRARNLHACAIRIASQFGGVFPDTEDGLRSLPGVGPYTAAAIAAIAFGRRAVVVDGNVERVATRLFAIAEAMPKAKAAVRAAMETITPAQRSGDFAQAMMDLGATLCTPKNPACSSCPFNEACIARAHGDMERYPVKPPKAERPSRQGAAFYLARSDGYALVRTRPPKGLLGGMTEFPGTIWEKDFDFADAVQYAPCKADWRRVTGSVEHVFTHFALRLAVFFARAPLDAATPDGCRWACETQLHDEALPSVMRKVAALAASRKLEA